MSTMLMSSIVMISTMWSTSLVMRRLSDVSLGSTSSSKTVSNRTDCTYSSNNNEGPRRDLETSAVFVRLLLDLIDCDLVNCFLFGFSLWSSRFSNLAPSLRCWRWARLSHASFNHMHWHDWCSCLWLDARRCLEKGCRWSVVNSDLLILMLMFQGWVLLAFCIHLLL